MSEKRNVRSSDAVGLSARVRRGVLGLAGTSALALVACMVPTLGYGQAPPEVEYTVVFEATWSAESHPDGFPPSPHFSGLIGGTHNDQVTFWEVGGLASPGMESMAEKT